MPAPGLILVWSETGRLFHVWGTALDGPASARWSARHFHLRPEEGTAGALDSHVGSVWRAGRTHGVAALRLASAAGGILDVYEVDDAPPALVASVRLDPKLVPKGGETSGRRLSLLRLDFLSGLVGGDTEMTEIRAVHEAVMGLGVDEEELTRRIAATAAESPEIHLNDTVVALMAEPDAGAGERWSIGPAASLVPGSSFSVEVAPRRARRGDDPAGAAAEPVAFTRELMREGRDGLDLAVTYRGPQAFQGAWRSQVVIVHLRDHVLAGRALVAAEAQPTLDAFHRSADRILAELIDPHATGAGRATAAGLRRAAVAYPLDSPALTATGAETVFAGAGADQDGLSTVEIDLEVGVPGIVPGDRFAVMARAPSRLSLRDDAVSEPVPAEDGVALRVFGAADVMPAAFDRRDAALAAALREGRAALLASPQLGGAAARGRSDPGWTVARLGDRAAEVWRLLLADMAHADNVAILIEQARLGECAPLRLHAYRDVLRVFETPLERREGGAALAGLFRLGTFGEAPVGELAIVMGERFLRAAAALGANRLRAATGQFGALLAVSGIDETERAAVADLPLNALTGLLTCGVESDLLPALVRLRLLPDDPWTAEGRHALARLIERIEAPGFAEEAERAAEVLRSERLDADAGEIDGFLDRDRTVWVAAARVRRVVDALAAAAAIRDRRRRESADLARRVLGGAGSGRAGTGAADEREHLRGIARGMLGRIFSGEGAAASAEEALATFDREARDLGDWQAYVESLKAHLAEIEGPALVERVIRAVEAWAGAPRLAERMAAERGGRAALVDTVRDYVLRFRFPGDAMDQRADVRGRLGAVEAELRQAILTLFGASGLALPQGGAGRGVAMVEIAYGYARALLRHKLAGEIDRRIAAIEANLERVPAGSDLGTVQDALRTLRWLRESWPEGCGPALERYERLLAEIRAGEDRGLDVVLPSEPIDLSLGWARLEVAREAAAAAH